ncbi:WecB/TagA/CpsF family glycosyltransferase [Candidatus Woesebacteria bacterium]|nr:WecB/TagA/CpsF family glycosyltransferase [Candidatus Woesebacteria bacterium]
MKLNSIRILGVRVNKTSKEEVLVCVKNFLNENRKFLIVTPNPEILVEAARNKKFAAVLNSAEIAIADGVGLKLADLSLEIIKGRQLMMELFKLADDLALKIYLLGSTEKVNQEAVMKATREYPNAKVAGAAGALLNSQGEPVGGQESTTGKAIVTEINQFKPDLLFVAFGAPKQELWVSRVLPKLKVGGVMVVGGSFDYFVGGSSVPKLVLSLGLEWLWRLIKEPWRAKRIFTAVFLFPLLLLTNTSEVQ